MSAPNVVLPPEQSFSEMQQSPHAAVHWIWEDYVAAGAVTLFTSRWKTGKTTLLSVLLARLSSGGDLTGAPVAPGKAVVVSEEAPAVWVERGQRFGGYGPHVTWLCRPFRSRPTADHWSALLDRLAERQVRDGLTLAVIDPLAAFLPGNDENSASGVMAALGPLQALTATGLAILILHHPRKKSPGDILEPRGSGALLGFSDVLVELDRPRGSAANDRRRWLRAASRYTAAPSELLIELNAEGSDYLVVDAAADEFLGGWPKLQLILSDARRRLSRADILADWPEDALNPHPTSVWRWLERAAAEGWIRCSGTGRRSDPLRYWLPERERYFLRELPPLEPLGSLEYEQSFAADLEYAKRLVGD
jgi:hypothetical protein